MTRYLNGATIRPLFTTNHLKMQIVVSASLVDGLKDIDQSNISDVRKMKLMEDSNMDSSMSLKGAADYCNELYPTLQRSVFGEHVDIICISTYV